MDAPRSIRSGVSRREGAASCPKDHESRLQVLQKEVHPNSAPAKHLEAKCLSPNDRAMPVTGRGIEARDFPYNHFLVHPASLQDTSRGREVMSLSLTPVTFTSVNTG